MREEKGISKESIDSREWKLQTERRVTNVIMKQEFHMSDLTTYPRTPSKEMHNGEQHRKEVYYMAYAGSGKRQDSILTHIPHVDIYITFKLEENMGVGEKYAQLLNIPSHCVFRWS
jgi:hypothetical protein